MSFLLLALFVGWQAEAVLHFLFTAHAIDQHGHVVHAPPNSGGESDKTRHQDDQEPKNKGEHKECRILALLTSAKTKVSSSSLLFAETDIFQTAKIIPFREIEALGESDLFELSPSNSPPSLV